MTPLAEIELTLDVLSAAEKREFVMFPAARLRGADAPLPEPRQWSREQMDEWIAEDEADLRRFDGQESSSGKNGNRARAGTAPLSVPHRY